MRFFSRALQATVAAIAIASAPGVAFAQPPAPLSAADLFNTNVVQRIELWMHSSDWEKLKQNFQENTYYPAEMVWNGLTTAGAGVRSRGLGSRSPTKPGLRVDFNRYATDGSFLGLKSIVLDNLTQDPSAIHETVAMRVYERMGVPAPREAHARLYVNGRYVGLYAVVESIDKDLLARVFGAIDGNVQNDGYLFEYEYIQGEPWRFDYLGSELEAYARRFDPATHENKSMFDKFAPIETMVRLVNEVPPSQFMERVGEYLDLQAFVRYMAVQNFLGENDGFVGYDGMNNFYMYRLENQNRHVFIAWDEDNAFWGPEFGLTTRHEENVLMRKVMEVPELRDLYFATLNETASMADTLVEGTEVSWLETEVRRQLDLVYDALNEDPSKPYTMDEHETQRNAMVIFAQQRGRYVQSNVPR